MRRRRNIRRAMCLELSEQVGAVAKPLTRCTTIAFVSDWPSLQRHCLLPPLLPVASVRFATDGYRSRPAVVGRSRTVDNLGQRSWRAWSYPLAMFSGSTLETDNWLAVCSMLRVWNITDGRFGSIAAGGFATATGGGIQQNTHHERLRAGLSRKHVNPGADRAFGVGANLLSHSLAR